MLILLPISPSSKDTISSSFLLKSPSSRSTTWFRIPFGNSRSTSAAASVSILPISRTVLRRSVSRRYSAAFSGSMYSNTSARESGSSVRKSFVRSAGVRSSAAFAISPAWNSSSRTCSALGERSPLMRSAISAAWSLMMISLFAIIVPLPFDQILLHLTESDPGTVCAELSYIITAGRADRIFPGAILCTSPVTVTVFQLCSPLFMVFLQHDNYSTIINCLSTCAANFSRYFQKRSTACTA